MARKDSSDLFDQLLVIEVQRGDKRAAERLYARWNPRLLRAARRYCGDGSMVADLVQECWLAIWKGLRSLRDPGRFRSYAFAVLHRRGSDQLRRVVRERGTMTDAPPSPDIGHEPTQADSAALAQAFATLPPDQRLAAHLYFAEGLTLAEIAEVQAIPEGTAKSRLFHARRKLKAALTPIDEGELL
ncbi:RNA polymerase subunit sigma-70 [Erythrobacter sp. KY5]|uniref:RNA polymerase sigma factor n=1 Tax=Erythrobacter sp. KY5 TaxID=2011159 RepID=UPI000DBF19B6|nr:RNA polymerase sigma factor [Erythrobacter sp. KY5]AWW74072.1 RNA polymerase subunit sigma-70 [Erythrobacter sp. KY5]